MNTSIFITPPHQENTKIIKGWDILKFIMALMVVDIHSGTSDYWKAEWLSRFNGILVEMAVPIFFVLSSYFVFKKTRKERTWKPIVNFEKRINSLYVHWIIVLLPVILTIWHKEYLQEDILTAVLLFIKNYFFAYQFGASWFLGALIVAVPIIVLLKKVFTERFIWVVPLIVYLYLNIADESHFIFSWYTENIRTPILSFPNGLLWLCLGFYMTNERIMVRLQGMPTSIYYIIVVIYFITGVIREEYTFVLILPTVVSVIMVFYKRAWNISADTCIFLRNCSIIIFCMHFSLISIICRLPLMGCKPLLFLVTLAISFSCSAVLIKLSEHKNYDWLKKFY